MAEKEDSKNSANKDPSDNPLKLKYVRLLRLFGYPFGIWPGNMLDEEMPGCYRYFIKQAPLQALVVLCGEINFLVRRHDKIDFFTIGDVCITSALTAVAFVRILLFNFEYYGVIWRMFFKNFHLGNFRKKGKNFEKVALKMDAVSNHFTQLFVLFSLFGMILFNVTPMFNNISNKAFTNRHQQNITLSFSVLYEFPGYKPEDHFLLTTFLNFYFSYACTICICALDLAVILMVLQVIGHIDVLSKNLKDYPLPQNKIAINFITNEGHISGTFENFTDQENELIHQKLKGSVNHHRFIVRFVKNMSSFFGPMIGFNYAYQLLCFCLLLLECSQLDSQSLARFGPLTLISMAQLIEISVTFEIVGSMSEKLIDSVYNLPWQFMDLRNQRTVYIFLNRVQKTIHVTCMGITPIGVQSMATILKTSFSYFTFLRSMDA